MTQRSDKPSKKSDPEHSKLFSTFFYPFLVMTNALLLLLSQTTTVNPLSKPTLNKEYKNSRKNNIKLSSTLIIPQINLLRMREEKYMNELIDPETGRPFFQPQIGRAPKTSVNSTQ